MAQVLGPHRLRVCQFGGHQLVTMYRLVIFVEALVRICYVNLFLVCCPLRIPLHLHIEYMSKISNTNERV